MKTLHEFVADYGGNISRAAEAAGVSYAKFFRWYHRKNYAIRDTREKMLARGIVLPERPR